MTLTQNLGPKNRGILAILEASGFQKIAEVKAEVFMSYFKSDIYSVILNLPYKYLGACQRTIF